jgi:hypothetical protein
LEGPFYGLMGETFDYIQLPIFHVGDYDKKQDLGDVI